MFFRLLRSRAAFFEFKVGGEVFLTFKVKNATSEGIQVVFRNLEKLTSQFKWNALIALLLLA